MKKGRKTFTTQLMVDTIAKHDVGRRRKTAGYVQPEFLSLMGTDYVKAWCLYAPRLFKRNDSK